MDGSTFRWSNCQAIALHRKGLGRKTADNGRWPDCPWVSVARTRARKLGERAWVVNRPDCRGRPHLKMSMEDGQHVQEDGDTGTTHKGQRPHLESCYEEPKPARYVQLQGGNTDRLE